MKHQFIDESGFKYVEAGSGTPIILLHGLMGGLSDFESVFTHFPKKGFRVLIPQLPLYDNPILKTNVKAFSNFLHRFIEHKKLDQAILLGNSLGGHIALVYTKMYPSRVKGLILTGSSGLYESAMGGSFPKRGDYEYIKKKTEDVFYNPDVATKEVIDVAAASTAVLTLAAWLPPTASLLTIIWMSLRIFESDTIQSLMKKDK